MARASPIDVGEALLPRRPLRPLPAGVSNNGGATLVALVPRLVRCATFLFESLTGKGVGEMRNRHSRIDT